MVLKISRRLRKRSSILGKARICLIDDPWSYRNRHETRKDNPTKKSKFGTGVASKYSLGVMKEQDLIDLGPLIIDCLEPDALVFSWATMATLDTHFRVMQARGFEYKTTVFSWEKLYPKNGETFKGTGRYTFSNIEIVTLWRLPKAPPLWHKNTGWKPQQVFRVPHPRDENNKIIHSRKPKCFHDAIDKWLDPYIGEYDKIELFATQETAGWKCFGFDVTGFDIKYDLANYAASHKNT